VYMTVVAYSDTGGWLDDRCIYELILCSGRDGAVRRLSMEVYIRSLMKYTQHS
jgi:hypothetical protein